MMLDATQRFGQPLTDERPFGWRASPFPTGYSGLSKIVIGDMALARSDGSSQRFYSMASQIRLERKDYYDTLEATRKGDTDINRWVAWFLGCLDRAFDGAEATLATVLAVARFWESHAGEAFNERQRMMLQRLLTGFEGKLTSSKWALIACVLRTPLGATSMISSIAAS